MEKPPRSRIITGADGPVLILPRLKERTSQEAPCVSINIYILENSEFLKIQYGKMGRNIYLCNHCIFVEIA